MRHENASVTGWLTLLVDLISMVGSFVLAGYIRGGILDSAFIGGIYTNAIIVLTFSIIVVSYVGKSSRDIFKRGYFAELVNILKDQSMIALIIFVYMFLNKAKS